VDSPRLLIVEDFEDLRKLVALYLDARGYHVIEAANGRTAMESAKAGKPDFILLDLRLPDVSGVEVARELRKLPQTENIPIVGWSADFKSNPQQKLLQHAGITDYLQKPTALKDIYAIVERFLPIPERQN